VAVGCPSSSFGKLMNIDDMKEALMGRKKTKKVQKELLSTGSTLLNLACSDNPHGAFFPGHYYFFVGDSTSGKTWLALSAFAEACQDPAFDDYQLIYDNAEDGALMNMSRFFGKKVADRLEAPARDSSSADVFSDTVESFYFHFADAIARGPCIYILDSMDALQTGDDIEKFSEQKSDWEKGKDDGAGSFGMSKAKLNSVNIREAIRGCRETQSILIIISQTRDNVGFGFEKKTRAGGRALKFYATLEIWTSVKGKITRTIRKKKRQLGIYAIAQVKKNRVSGKDRSVEIPIYHSYGVDDVGACIDYLVDEQHWKKSKNSIVADDFDMTASRDALIAHIEENELEAELADIVGDVWKEIEAACALKRKKRYE